ncbi:hypothetical protein CSC80_05120 [Maribacter sp. 6B07]|nr:hypothetical protein CSC80_05120 [Maribacter sp. 6B07]
MKNNELVHLLEYASPFSILIVDANNTLLELRCPFNVIGINDHNLILQNEVYVVERIRISKELSVVYEIEQRLFHYYHFDILN